MAIGPLNPVIIELTVKSTSVRSVSSPIRTPDAQAVISIFDGIKVRVKAYSAANMCFSMTEEMMRNGFSKNATPTGCAWFVSKDQLETLITKFTTVNHCGYTMACSIGDLFVKESAKEIKSLITSA